MTSARTSNRLVRFAAAGIAGAAALLVPLAGSASAAFEPVPVGVTPLPVQAGVVTSVNGILTIDTATNSASELIIHPGGINEMFLVRDTTAPLNPGAGCFTFEEWGIVCKAASHVVVRAGNFGDRVVLDATYTTADLDGGSGNDTITGGKGVDWINGGTGQDTINGYTGNDSLNGGNDADYDRIYGGAGTDECVAGSYYYECENAWNNSDVR